MMEWQTEINEFLDYLQIERHSSINTVMAYRNDLRQFAIYLTKNLPASATWSDLQRQTIEDYSREISAGSHTPATIARKIAALKTLLTWLQHNGRAQDGLAGALKSPRVEKRVPHVLSEAQVQSLFEATARMPAPRSLRDRALLELIYSTGMRVTEAIGLFLPALDLDGATASTEGRGLRQRSAPLTPQAVSALRNYVENGRRDMLGSTQSDYVFLNPMGTKLTRQAVWQLTRHYARVAGITGDITPHTLRHSRASHMLSNGTEIRRVQEWLGHANLATTQMYQGREPARVPPTGGTPDTLS